jgi:hypothetical protein
LERRHENRVRALQGGLHPCVRERHARRGAEHRYRANQRVWSGLASLGPDDDRHAGDAAGECEYFARADALGFHEPAEQKCHDRRRGQQDRHEAGGHELRAPEHQRIIGAKQQHPRDCDAGDVARVKHTRVAAEGGEGREDDQRTCEPDPGKCEWRISARPILMKRNVLLQSRHANDQTAAR